ncbi:MAG TPA: ABC transporter ATP-binding protein, partial [Firmicutes bacterium]|nr:ABC transporter ATP-binding protein [Bacillota bacterium]
MNQAFIDVQPNTKIETVLEVEDLHVHFNTPEGVVRAVDGISFDIEKGETLCLVGESGCGKTVTSTAIIGLLPKYRAKVFAEKMSFEGRDLLGLSSEQLRQIRGKEISMIFQEPMTSLNPVYTVGMQLAEVFKTHTNLSSQEIWNECVNIIDKVGIPSPEEKLRAYPHQLSGGLRQRSMIAMALASKPKLLIADEPTTALDVTIQAQILELLQGMRDELSMSILLITHDFGVVSEVADNVAVMYAGKIVEKSPLKALLEDPLHPYTRALLSS